MSKTKRRKNQAKTAFYRVFIKLNEHDEKREVFAMECRWSDVTKYTNGLKANCVSYIVTRGNVPQQVVDKFNA